MILLLGGFAFVLIGLLAIVFGFQIKEFSLGNTSMLGGAVSIGTGAILLGLHAAVRELASVAREVATSAPARMASPVRQPQPPNADDPVPAAAGPDGGFLFSRDEPAPSREPEPQAEPELGQSIPPWQDVATSRDRGRPRELPAPEPEPAAESKGRRNLLFSSSRKERERAALRPDPSAESGGASGEPAPRTTFDQAWPERPRAESPLRRRPSAIADPEPDSQPETAVTGGDEAVTVLKSGVVDGMAYSLFSDGSIEAQMPEGLMRFASIEELRSHLDQRP